MKRNSERMLANRRLSRRSVLRGLGATIALPWLESIPVWGAEPTSKPSTSQ